MNPYITKHSIMKETIEKITLENGFTEGEIQVSKDVIVFLDDFFYTELEGIIKDVLDYITEENERKNYVKLKRITKNLIKKALFSSLDEKHIKKLLSMIEKYPRSHTSKNDIKLG